MNVANRIMVFLLVAALSLLGGGQERGAAAHGAYAVEICDEGRITVILVDEDGQPVTPCDCAACPDCAVPALAMLPLVPIQARRTTAARTVRFMRPFLSQGQPQHGLPLPRGPPARKEMT